MMNGHMTDNVADGSTACAPCQPCDAIRTEAERPIVEKIRLDGNKGVRYYGLVEDSACHRLDGTT
jgi:hypothetical protein